MRTPPKHWASVDQPAQHEGHPIMLRIWGGSTISHEDARAAARERAAALIAAGGPGRADASWYYPRTRQREEVLEEVHAEDGELIATITRNRYGALILTTDALLIADVDLPEGAADRPAGGGRLGRLVRALTGAAAPEPGADAGTPHGPEAEALARIDRFALEHPGLGVRTHRTRAGFRVMITGSGHAPGGPEAQALLEELGSDPLYVRLSRAYETSRARLTPKPWRTGMSAPPVRWPAQDHGAEQRLRTWIEQYEQRSAGFAACRRIRETGPLPSAVEQRILTLHDRLSGTDSGRPLA
ncbi:hypothetical protein [Brachybacterium hainanense]|uniref:Uncharacterized protein n=1 Tax=Brachybacterium hainanense TaxID=1541174 RepID=A0ABV6RGT6_9MICO